MPHAHALTRAFAFPAEGHPDDLRGVHVNTWNRMHRYKENYMGKVGEGMGAMKELAIGTGTRKSERGIHH